MNKLMNNLAVSFSACCLLVSGCAADGFYESVTPTVASSDVFSPPPLTSQRVQTSAPIATPTYQPAPVADQPIPTAYQPVAADPSLQASHATAQTSFQMSDPQPVPIHRSVVSAVPAQRVAAASIGRARVMTLGPNDDLAKLVKAAPGVVLIDFYADWCGPCRTQGEILHGLKATASLHNASIIKVNVDQHEAIAGVLKVSSLPTLVLVKDGKIIERKTGLADEREVSVMLAR